MGLEQVLPRRIFQTTRSPRRNQSAGAAFSNGGIAVEAVSGALPDRDGGREAVNNVVWPLGKVTAVGPVACRGHEILPGSLIERPAGGTGR